MYWNVGQRNRLTHQEVISVKYAMRRWQEKEIGAGYVGMSVAKSVQQELELLMTLMCLAFFAKSVTKLIWQRW